MCEELLVDNPQFDPVADDEEVFQYARKRVGAFIQNIVYHEWLPAMGVEVSAYSGYDDSINPSIFNLFSAAAYRWGHTMINNEILRLNEDGTPIAAGHLELRDGFFKPTEVLRFELDPYLRGMGVQFQQNLDCQVVGAVRNFLFEGNPVFGGLDLVSINIQRGRERGIPDYNSIRKAYGLAPAITFSDICEDPTLSSLLEEVYGSVDVVDPWVGMLAEDHLPNAMFGELIETIMLDQFIALRNGDRYYFENDPALSGSDLEEIRSTKLSDIILRNSDIECIQSNVFIQTEIDDVPCWPFVIRRDLDVAMAPNPVVDGSLLNIYSIKEGPVLIRRVDSGGRIVWVAKS